MLHGMYFSLIEKSGADRAIQYFSLITVISMEYCVELELWEQYCTKCIFPWTRKGERIGAYNMFPQWRLFQYNFLLGVIYKFTITRNVFFLEPERQSGSGHTICFLNEWAAAVSAQDAGRGLRIPQWERQKRGNVVWCKNWGKNLSNSFLQTELFSHIMNKI